MLRALRLLTKARAQAKANNMKFASASAHGVQLFEVATRHWQRVPEGVALPAGLEAL